MNKQLIYPIFCSYFKNREFRIVSILALLGLAQTYLYGPLDIKQIGVSENWLIDILRWLLMFFISIVAGFIWSVIFGFILKSQFAHPRSTIFPHFRSAHIQVALFFYVCYLLIMFISRANVLALFAANISAYTYFVLLGFFSIVIIWFAYVYHQMFWNWIWFPYLFWFFLRDWFKSINPEILLSLAAISFPLLVVALGVRLMRLNEDMYEYTYVFSSDRKDLFKATIKSQQFYSGLWEKLGDLFHKKEIEKKIEKYPTAGNLLARASHWRGYIFGHTNYIWRFGLFFAAWMIFVEYKYGGKHASNYFFTVFFPPMMAWGQFILWSREKSFKSLLGLDLLKPLRRENFIKEAGLAVLLQSLEFFLAMFLYFEVVGRAVFSPLSLATNEIWVQLAIALCVQIVIFGFMACLTKFTAKWGHIFFFVWIGMMIVIPFSFFYKAKFDLYTNLILGLVLLVGGVLLSRIASRLWYLTEMN